MKEVWSHWWRSVVTQFGVLPVCLVAMPVFTFCNFQTGHLPSWCASFVVVVICVVIVCVVLHRKLFLGQFVFFNLAEDFLFYWVTLCSVFASISLCLVFRVLIAVHFRFVLLFCRHIACCTCLGSSKTCTMSITSTTRHSGTYCVAHCFFAFRLLFCRVLSCLRDFLIFFVFMLLYCSVAGAQAHPFELVFNFLMPTILPPLLCGWCVIVICFSCLVFVASVFLCSFVAHFLIWFARFC